VTEEQVTFCEILLTVPDILEVRWRLRDETESQVRK
jgi:hypothetical protein